MSIISQQTWDNMPKEEKEQIIQKYSHLLQVSDNDDSWEVRMCANSEKETLITLYGKENLQPKPKIPKTWDDVKNAYPKTYGNENIELFPYHEFAWDIKLTHKNIATLKISKLIELGYGGMVNEEECEDGWEITPIQNELVIQHSFTADKPFVFFHTQQQAEEFMSYPENVELIRQYYMF